MFKCETDYDTPLCVSYLLAWGDTGGELVTGMSPKKDQNKPCLISLMIACHNTAETSKRIMRLALLSYYRPIWHIFLGSTIELASTNCLVLDIPLSSGIIKDSLGGGVYSSLCSLGFAISSKFEILCIQGNVNKFSVFE